MNTKATFIFILTILFLIACTNERKNKTPKLFKNPIVGKWKSDKEKTFEWLKETRGFSDERIRKLEDRNIYGRLILIISQNKCISYLEGDDNIDEMPIEIIGIESDTIAYVAKDPISEEREIRLILVEDQNNFSIYQDDFDIREFFKKIE